MGNVVLSFLVYLFPKEVVAKMIVTVLRNLATHTDNTIDDAIVKTVAKGLGMEDE